MPTKAKLPAGHLMLNAVIPATLRDQVKSRAALSHMQMQEAIRVALERWLASTPSTAGTQQQQAGTPRGTTDGLRIGELAYTVKASVRNVQSKLSDSIHELDTILGKLDEPPDNVPKSVPKPNPSDAIGEVLERPRDIKRGGNEHNVGPRKRRKG